MTETLRLRIMTALILSVMALISVLLFSPSLFSVVVLVVFIGIGGWEWSKLVSLEDRDRGLFVLCLLVLSYFAYYSITLRWLFTVLGFFWWVVALFFLFTYRAGTAFYRKNTWILKCGAFFVLLPAFASSLSLHDYNPVLVVYLIFLVAAADSGAYFTGKSFGKNKLAPELSPGKTLEGMFGGVLGAFLLSVVSGLLLDLPDGKLGYFVCLSLILAVISVAGDLFESLLKREAGQKDSGTILPGHGGVLDRVDGLIAVLPLFALGLHWGEILI